MRQQWSEQQCKAVGEQLAEQMTGLYGYPMQIFGINVDLMNDTLNQPGKVTDWNRLYEKYQTSTTTYSPQRIDRITPNEWKLIKEILDLSGARTVPQLRRNFKTFLLQHPELYHANIHEMLQRLQKAKEQVQANNDLEWQYLDWYPEYGGVFLEKGLTQLEFLKKSE